jgi:hypothetical protein
VLINYIFRPLKRKQGSKEINIDLRGAFIAAINSFAKNTFNNLELEYLESNNILFIFKAVEIKAYDSRIPEPLILYGLIDKFPKDTDKFVKAFLQKSELLLELFKSRYNNKDFSELSQFKAFGNIIKDFMLT